MELYNLLPEIIRRKDQGTKGAGSAETVLERIFYAFETDVGTSKDLVDGLRDLFDISNCPKQYLPLLQRFLGSSWPGEWGQQKIRKVLKGLVKLYHTSGQRL